MINFAYCILHTYVGDAIMIEDKHESSFSEICIITTSLSILAVIVCVLTCLFCYFYKQAQICSQRFYKRLQNIYQRFYLQISHQKERTTNELTVENEGYIDAEDL